MGAPLGPPTPTAGHSPAFLKEQAKFVAYDRKNSSLHVHGNHPQSQGILKSIRTKPAPMKDMTPNQG